MKNDITSILSITSDLRKELDSIVSPPEEGNVPLSYGVIPNAITKGTRGYIEKIAQQINGCYENGWYDACAVMIRKLLEILIIEAFEKRKIDDQIKNTDGDFYFLRDLIGKTLSQGNFNLGRNVKKGLPKLKDIGDKSAHARRYTTLLHDIDSIKTEFRDAVQELISIAELK